LPTEDVEYAVFVQRVWPEYLRIATLLCGDQHEAEDLLQDCLVALYPRWGKLARRGDPTAYLRRMLVNRRVSRWRRRRREILTDRPPDSTAPSGEPGDPHPELAAALRSLPRHQRAVVVLRYYADLTEADVASTLGCSIGTVKSQHARAMTRLRAHMPKSDLLKGRTG